MLIGFGRYMVNLFNNTCLVGSIISRSFYNFRNIHTRNFRYQFLYLGFNSLPITILTSLFVSMVFAVQVATEFLRFGAGNMVGGVMGVSVWRELAPALTAVVVAGRVGSAIAAEIGSMKVTEQIDAIKSFGVDYFDYLVNPRVWALVLVMPLLVAIADLVGILGSYIISVHFVGINAIAFFDSLEMLLSFRDLWGGLLKSLFFGLTTAAISCHYGLQTKAGARGVGQATTYSVVISLITIFILNYILSVLIF